MKLKDVAARLGDAVDGQQDGQYDHNQTEERLGKETGRFAEKIANKPVVFGYALLGAALLLAALAVYAIFK